MGIGGGGKLSESDICPKVNWDICRRVLAKFTYGYMQHLSKNFLII